MRKERQVKIKSLQQRRCEKPFTQVLENSKQIIKLSSLSFSPFHAIPPPSPLPPENTSMVLYSVCIQNTAGTEDLEIHSLRKKLDGQLYSHELHHFTIL